MSQKHFIHLLNKYIINHSLKVIFPNKEIHYIGKEKPQVVWRIHDNSAINEIIKYPELKLGETYMAGQWDIEEGTLTQFLGILMQNVKHAQISKFKLACAHLLRTINTIKNSKKNVMHHYDLDNNFYELFLDDQMHYSCAYFADDNFTLEQAQHAKCHLISKKLYPEQAKNILDIGSGWGSMGLYLAEHTQANVTGITLSKAQLEYANNRIRRKNLNGRVNFLLEDYRNHVGQYDCIVSVGMFEHVGKEYYDTFFKRINELLAKNGRCLLHTIGRYTSPNDVNPWIHKYIFPGGYLPSLSEMVTCIEKNDLMVTDVEVLRLHYAKTLQQWLNRFQEKRDIVKHMFDETFCRMWEFYLSSSEASFIYDDLNVYQIQICKDRTAVPITRNYLFQETSEDCFVGQSAVAGSAR